MEYNCILRHGSRRETWTGRLFLLGRGPGWYEAEIDGRGTYFHILAGRHKYGNYLCIPNHDIGCELSDFSDIFWNEERLSHLIRKVDAVTVATGLVHLPTLADKQGKTKCFIWAADLIMGSMAFCISGGKQYRQQRAAFWAGLCICRQHCAVNGINVRKIIRCLLLPQFAVRQPNRKLSVKNILKSFS